MKLCPWLFVTRSLAACGLRPVYSGGSHGSVAQALGNGAVQPIEGKGGCLVRNALNDRLAAMRGTGPGYRLVVKLDDNISGFGLRSDPAITRERRRLLPRYPLIVAANGGPILEARESVV